MVSGARVVKGGHAHGRLGSSHYSLRNFQFEPVEQLPSTFPGYAPLGILF